MQNIVNMVLFVTARLNVARDEANERGATATEYALLVAFIAVVITVGVTAFGGQLNSFFNTLGSKVGILSSTSTGK